MKAVLCFMKPCNTAFRLAERLDKLYAYAHMRLTRIHQPLSSLDGRMKVLYAQAASGLAFLSEILDIAEERINGF